MSEADDILSVPEYRQHFQEALAKTRSTEPVEDDPQAILAWLGLMEPDK